MSGNMQIQENRLDRCFDVSDGIGLSSDASRVNSSSGSGDEMYPRPQILDFKNKDSMCQPYP
jgi:hypothetical protein